MYTLKRATEVEYGTFGVLLNPLGHPICVTCEDPWNQNQIGISCIPQGTYQCEKYSGTKYKNVWIVKDVPGRTAILIHIGNTHLDTRGCILVGQKFGIVKGLPAVLSSGLAMAFLRKTLPNKFTLNIT